MDSEEVASQSHEQDDSNLNNLLAEKCKESASVHPSSNSESKENGTTISFEKQPVECGSLQISEEKNEMQFVLPSNNSKSEENLAIVQFNVTENIEKETDHTDVSDSCELSKNDQNIQSSLDLELLNTSNNSKKTELDVSESIESTIALPLSETDHTSPSASLPNNSECTENELDNVMSCENPPICSSELSCNIVQSSTDQTDGDASVCLGSNCSNVVTTRPFSKADKLPGVSFKPEESFTEIKICDSSSKHSVSSISCNSSVDAVQNGIDTDSLPSHSLSKTPLVCYSSSDSLSSASDEVPPETVDEEDNRGDCVPTNLNNTVEAFSNSSAKHQSAEVPHSNSIPLASSSEESGKASDINKHAITISRKSSSSSESDESDEMETSCEVAANSEDPNEVIVIDTVGSYRKGPIVIDSSDSESMTSDSEESSSSSSDDEESTDNDDDDVFEISAKPETKADKKKSDAPPRYLKDFTLDDLPRIDKLQITVAESEAEAIGTILSIVDRLVIVDSHENLKPVDEGSILFLKKGKEALGEVFEVMGPISRPLYSVRFNSAEELKERHITVGEEVFYAPHTDYATFVDVPGLIMVSGSDASWENDREPPLSKQDFSDDEQERIFKRSIKQNVARPADQMEAEEANIPARAKFQRVNNHPKINRKPHHSRNSPHCRPSFGGPRGPLNPFAPNTRPPFHRAPPSFCQPPPPFTPQPFANNPPGPPNQGDYKPFGGIFPPSGPPPIFGSTAPPPNFQRPPPPNFQQPPPPSPQPHPSAPPQTNQFNPPPPSYSPCPSPLPPGVTQHYSNFNVPPPPPPPPSSSFNHSSHSFGSSFATQLPSFNVPPPQYPPFNGNNPPFNGNNNPFSQPCPPYYPPNNQSGHGPSQL